MTSNADAKVVLVFSQLGAALLCFIFLGFPNFFILNSYTFSLILLSAFFWSVGVYTEILALEYIDTSTSGVVGSFRYLIVCSISYVFFAEHYSLSNVLGAALVVLAIVGMGGLGFNRMNFKKGFKLQLFSVFPQVLAYSIDKHLTKYLDAEFVTTAAYLFPALLLVLFYPKNLLKIKTQIKRSNYLLVLIPIGVFLCYYFLVKAFSLGTEFKIGMALVESSVIINWFFAFFIFKDREAAKEKLVFCLLCFLGLVLVTS